MGLRPHLAREQRGALLLELDRRTGAARLAEAQAASPLELAQLLVVPRLRLPLGVKPSPRQGLASKVELAQLQVVPRLRWALLPLSQRAPQRLMIRFAVAQVSYALACQPCHTSMPPNLLGMG